MCLDTFHAIVLAAGKGSRMKSHIPKVLLPLCGRPILRHVLDALEAIEIPKIAIVVSAENSDAIRRVLGNKYVYAIQQEPLGSGHAVMCARDSVSDSRNILVMCGDSPLFQPETIHLLTEKHLQEKATLTLTSAIVHNPTGYGRILRNDKGEIEGIVEEKVASDKEKEIREVNGGCYAFNAIWLWKNINLMHKNEVGEYCLTEMVDIAVAQQQKVCAISANADEIVGINTFQDLQAAEAILQARGKHT